MQSTILRNKKNKNNIPTSPVTKAKVVAKAPNNTFDLSVKVCKKSILSILSFLYFIQAGTDDTHYVTPKGVKEGAEKFGGGVELQDGTLSKWVGGANARIQTPSIYDLGLEFEQFGPYYLCAPNKSWYIIVSITGSSPYTITLRLFDYNTDELKDILTIGIQFNSYAFDRSKSNNRAICFYNYPTTVYFYEITENLTFGKNASVSISSFDSALEYEQDSFFNPDDKYLYFAHGTQDTIKCAIFNIETGEVSDIKVASGLSYVSNISTIWGANNEYYMLPWNGNRSTELKIFSISNTRVNINVTVTQDALKSFLACYSTGVIICTYYDKYYSVFRLPFGSTTVTQLSGDVGYSSSEAGYLSVLCDKNLGHIYCVSRVNNIYRCYEYIVTGNSIGEKPRIQKIYMLYYNQVSGAEIEIYPDYFYVPFTFAGCKPFIEIDEKSFCCSFDSYYSNLSEHFKAPFISLGGVKIKD